MRLKSFALLLIGLLLFSGCATKNSYSKLDFGNSPVDQAFSERLRAAKLYRKFETILIVDAITNDEELVNVWADEYGRSNQLEGQEIVNLKAKHIEEMSGKTQFIIALYTAEREWNDLDKNDSRWTVSLKNGNGALHATSVIEIDAKELIFRDNIPFDHRFRTFYVASFSEDQAGAPPWRLSISGLLGSIELVWEK